MPQLTRIVPAVLALFFTATAPVAAVTIMPPGNQSATQPPIPGASAKRTAQLKTTFEAKYKKIKDLIAGDRKLQSKIRDAAASYGIDPIHIIGALVGEHTFNVDAYDRFQTYYVKAMSYAGSAIRFAYEGEKVTEFVERPQFSPCAGETDSYGLWTCREKVWDTVFRGRVVGGTVWPNNRFSAVFFQPFYAGQTFGLGQLNPLTALETSDLVSRVSGFPKLSAKRPKQVYATIMDPDKTLPYVAAAIRMSIDAYRDIAGIDISGNPGITATLYNLGNPEDRAEALKTRGGLPKENFYGWFVNEKLDELRPLM
ncbi:DUF1402 family protein [Notoacmeibacter sp. MSK16QG-6]|uniref:DUF1402 family protein n=1 Tax=Notoacmeibacter sp. MSK16QG-6 TaxID=2957982 RepID=UPI00209DB90C|nr:DUF1402 family protein [Notoacmeibacter sp. MSK16QG-6]MCP1199096.1 DUF1402 family protein [Notoacmeibacter sp. MSK16QG-6]